MIINYKYTALVYLEGCSNLEYPSSHIRFSDEIIAEKKNEHRIIKINDFLRIKLHRNGMYELSIFKEEEIEIKDIDKLKLENFENAIREFVKWFNLTFDKRNGPFRIYIYPILEFNNYNQNIIEDIKSNYQIYEIFSRKGKNSKFFVTPEFSYCLDTSEESFNKFINIILTVVEPRGYTFLPFNSKLLKKILNLDSRKFDSNNRPIICILEEIGLQSECLINYSCEKCDMQITYAACKNKEYKPISILEHEKGGIGELDRIRHLMLNWVDSSTTEEEKVRDEFEDIRITTVGNLIVVVTIWATIFSMGINDFNIKSIIYHGNLFPLLQTSFFYIFFVAIFAFIFSSISYWLEFNDFSPAWPNIFIVYHKIMALNLGKFSKLLSYFGAIFSTVFLVSVIFLIL